MQSQTCTSWPRGSLLQVTRENFRQVLPLFKEALEGAAFLALDLEFSGLSVRGNEGEYLDDVEDRHEQVSPPVHIMLCWEFHIEQSNQQEAKWAHVPK